MTLTTSPRLSIGLPVYNGENYLPRTLESIITQDYEDFEVVISDNASSDATREICLDYAKSDERIRYLRQETNVGAAENYNIVYRESVGELFKWATHDDVLFPGFLSRCIEGLDEHPRAVLAYPRYVPIDSDGNRGTPGDPRPELSSLDPAVRLKRVIWQRSIWRRNNTFPMFGVIRSEAIEATRLHGKYTGEDRTFLAELALQGPFHEVSEVLLGYRFHDEQSMALAGTQSGLSHSREGWFDPSREGAITFPTWRRHREYATATLRAPLSRGEKVRCLGVLASWALTGDWKRLVRDVAVAIAAIVRRSYNRDRNVSETI